MTQGNKKKYFVKAQEACRKDVEREFGVLQARFAIIRGPAREWDKEKLAAIMKACIIMHNMIDEDYFSCDDMGEKVKISHNGTPGLDEFIQNYKNIQDKETHT